MDNSIFSNFHGQLLVGFSGGADSTALLLMAARGAEKSGCELLAVHFNHHLRGEESDKEAQNAEDFARKLKVKFLKIDLHIPPGGNLESRARQARLEKWKELCEKFSDPVVLLGHHLDDRVENLFIRIGRGSNASGLTGMQMYSEVDGVKFFRPLLIYTRSEIEEFLRENGVTSWAVDSSNINGEFCRNILRNRILPEFYDLFPGGKKAVISTLENLSYDAAYLDETAMNYYNNADDRYKVSFWYLHRDMAMICRMLRLLCKDFFNDDSPLTSGSVRRFADMVENQKSGMCVLDERRILHFSGGMIYPHSEKLEKVLWNWKKERSIVWGNWRFTAENISELPENTTLFQAYFNAAELPEILEIGVPQDGEKMVPFGRKNAVKIKDLRIKRKIAAFPVNPVLRTTQKKVIFLPGIHHSAESLFVAGESGMMISAEKIKDFAVKTCKK